MQLNIREVSQPGGSRNVVGWVLYLDKYEMTTCLYSSCDRVGDTCWSFSYSVGPYPKDVREQFFTES